MGDPLDEHDETHGRVSEVRGKTVTEDPPANRERIRVYLRDHPGVKSRALAEALGIDDGQVRKLVRKMRADKHDAEKDAPKGEKREPLDEPQIQSAAEERAKGAETTHLANKISEENNLAIDEAIGVGKWVRDYYVGRGLHSEFPSSSAFLQTAVAFWWENRASIGELRQTIDQLREDLDLAYEAMDPELEYQHAVETIQSRAIRLGLLGIKVPSETWGALLDAAAKHRATPHGIDSLIPTPTGEEQHG